MIWLGADAANSKVGTLAHRIQISFPIESSTNGKGAPTCCCDDHGIQDSFLSCRSLGLVYEKSELDAGPRLLHVYPQQVPFGSAAQYRARRTSLGQAMERGEHLILRYAICDSIRRATQSQLSIFRARWTPPLYPISCGLVWTEVRTEVVCLQDNSAHSQHNGHEGFDNPVGNRCATERKIPPRASVLMRSTAGSPPRCFPFVVNTICTPDLEYT